MTAARRWSLRPIARLRPGHVLARAGVDLDPVTLVDEERNLHGHPGLERRGLVAATRRRVAADAGVGLRDGELDRGGHLDVRGPLVDVEKVDLLARRHP